MEVSCDKVVKNFADSENWDTFGRDESFLPENTYLTCEDDEQRPEYKLEGCWVRERIKILNSSKIKVVAQLRHIL